MAQYNNVEIVNVDILFQILNEEKIDFFDGKQIDYNLSMHFTLSNGRVIVMPNSGNNGLIFESEEAFKKALEDGYFPTQDEKSIFEEDKEKIKNINDNLEYFLKKVKLIIRC